MILIFITIVMVMTAVMLMTMVAVLAVLFITLSSSSWLAQAAVLQAAYPPCSRPCATSDYCSFPPHDAMKAQKHLVSVATQSCVNLWRTRSGQLEDPVAERLCLEA